MNTRKWPSMLCAIFWGLFAMNCQPEYDTAAFGGDGEIVQKRGEYPQITINLRPCSLSSSGEYVWRFHGVPDLDYQVLLALDSSDLAGGQLEHINGSLRLELTTEQGKLLCATEGPLATWKLMQGGGKLAIWRDECRLIALKRDESYLMRLTVADVDSRASSLRCRPELSGGGRELP